MDCAQTPTLRLYSAVAANDHERTCQICCNTGEVEVGLGVRAGVVEVGLGVKAQVGAVGLGIEVRVETMKITLHGEVGGLMVKLINIPAL